MKTIINVIKSLFGRKEESTEYSDYLIECAIDDIFYERKDLEEYFYPELVEKETENI